MSAPAGWQLQRGQVDGADSELAQAASTTQLVPPRSSRLAIRPATTLPSRPGNEFSCQAT